MVVEVILPKLGQTMEEGTILEWYRKEGDAVRKGDPLFQLESDKAALDVESPGRGVLRRIFYEAGAKLPVLTAVALIAGPDEDISGYVQAGAPGAQVVPALPAKQQLAESAMSEIAPRERIFASPRARRRAKAEGIDLANIAGSGPSGRIEEKDVVAWLDSQPKATPVARKMAEEVGLVLATVKGTGVSGRITQEDVQRALQERAKPTVEPVVAAPTAAPAAVAAPITLTGLRGIIARRMAESHQTTAPVTLTMEVDATAFVALREQLKVALA